MTHPSDIAGLSELCERLKWGVDGPDDHPVNIELRREAREMLQTQAAELDSLSARVKELEEDAEALAIAANLQRTRAEAAESRALRAEQQRDEAKQSLYLAKNDADNLRDALHEATTRLQSELDTANANHRDMAAQLAQIGRERDEAYERAAKAARQIAINAERRAADHTPQSQAEEAALNKAQGAFDAEAAIRRLASGPEGGAKP